MNAPDDCPTLEDCVVASDGIPGVTQPEDARAALAAELAELRRKAAAWDQHIGEAALDPSTPIEMIDAELRAMGVDPEALAARGVAFVAGLKADLAAKVDTFTETNAAQIAAVVEATLECRVALVEFDTNMSTVGFRTDGDVRVVREALRVRLPAGYVVLVEPGF